MKQIGLKDTKRTSRKSLKNSIVWEGDVISPVWPHDPDPKFPPETAKSIREGWKDPKAGWSPSFRKLLGEPFRENAKSKMKKRKSAAR